MRNEQHSSWTKRHAAHAGNKTLEETGEEGEDASKQRGISHRHKGSCLQR